MGLFTDLLLLPVTGPYRGLRFLLEQIQEQANTEMFDPARIQAELMSLGLRLDQGELTEDEYLEAEALLLERLNQARAHWEEPAGGYAIEADTAAGDGADGDADGDVDEDPDVWVETDILDGAEPGAARGSSG